jgi:hypothetical protein
MLEMRFTIETNSSHPRAKDWLNIFPQWLGQLDVRSEAQSWDVEILTTPLGELDEAQQTDARWSAEAAGVLGWALQRLAAPADFEPVDPNEIFPALGLQPAGILQGAQELIAGASLRSKDELFACYARLRTVQCCMRCRSVAMRSADPIVQSVLREQLDELGVLETEFAAAQEDVARLSDDQFIQLSGTYFARVYTAKWLVGERDRYWEVDEAAKDN